jgi:hypothetical protein
MTLTVTKHLVDVDNIFTNPRNMAGIAGAPSLSSSPKEHSFSSPGTTALSSVSGRGLFCSRRPATGVRPREMMELRVLIEKNHSEMLLKLTGVDSRLARPKSERRIVA